MGTLEDVLGIGIILAIAYVGWNALSSGGLKLGGPTAAGPAPVGGGSCPSPPGSGIPNQMPRSGTKMTGGEAKTTGVSLRNGTQDHASVAGNIMTLTGKSPRFYIAGEFTSNVELSAYFKGPAKTIELVAPTNHPDKGGFGGYALYINHGDKSMFYKKEISHEGGYTPRLASKKINLNTNSWYGMKTVVTTEGSNVKMVGCFDDGHWMEKNNRSYR